MNFLDFKNSNFYHVGKMRYDYKNNKFHERKVAIFDTYPIDHLTDDDSYILEENFDRTNRLQDQLTLVHLRRALEVDSGYTPIPFRKMIGHQWIEVNRVLSRLNVKPKSSMLVLQEPGTVVDRHRHLVKQVLTFCFSYNEDRVNNFDISGLSLGPKEASKFLPYPKNDKFWFTLNDSVLHESISNEWRFFYFHDFDEYVTMPDDTIFTKFSF